MTGSKIIKPVIYERYFFILSYLFMAGCFLFLSIETPVLSVSIGTVVFTIFSYLFFETNNFKKLKNYIYIHKDSFNSNIFEGKQYYKYINYNREEVFFYKNKAHNEKGRAANRDYYINGYHIDFLKYFKGVHYQTLEYILNCKEYKTSNEFFSYIGQYNYEKVEMYLKENKVELNSYHILLAINSNSIEFIPIFKKYYNVEIFRNIEETLLIASKYSKEYSEYLIDLMEKENFKIKGNYNCWIISNLLENKHTFDTFFYYLKVNQNAYIDSNNADYIVNKALILLPENLVFKFLDFDIFEKLDLQGRVRYNIDYLLSKRRTYLKVNFF